MTTSAVTADGRARVLADGHRIPLLGLGVWQVPDGRPCIDAVTWALELGYRHIDTAQAYGNEESVGTALRASGVPRDQVFITTKFFPGDRDPVAALERSLRRLQVDHVDLYLIHWPQGGATWAWPGMQRAHELGHARSVGVSNFSVAQLGEVTALGGIAAGRQPGAVQRPPLPARAARRLRAERHRAGGVQPARARAGTSATRPSGRWPGSWDAARPRSCCAGACSVGSR